MELESLPIIIDPSVCMREIYIYLVGVVFTRLHTCLDRIEDIGAIQSKH